MSDIPQVLNTLRTKAVELTARIGELGRALEQAKIDLAHINASIMLFEAPAAGEQHPMHFNLGDCLRARARGALP